MTLPKPSAIQYKPSPDKRAKHLYIIAGPSGSGKSTLIGAAARQQAQIFGSDSPEASYVKALKAICHAKTRLDYVQPIEVTSGCVITLDNFQALSEWGAPRLA